MLKRRKPVLIFQSAVKALDTSILNRSAGSNEHKLNAVLYMDTGGNVAANLRRIYCFIIKRLSEANIKKDPRLIREVTKLMEGLNQSWKAIIG